MFNQPGCSGGSSGRGAVPGMAGIKMACTVAGISVMGDMPGLVPGARQMSGQGGSSGGRRRLHQS